MKALATIETDAGKMIINFIGQNEPLEAVNPETGDAEYLDYSPIDEDDAICAIDEMYSGTFWGLEWIENI